MPGDEGLGDARGGAGDGDGACERLVGAEDRCGEAGRVGVALAVGGVEHALADRRVWRSPGVAAKASSTRPPEPASSGRTSPSRTL